MRKPLFAILMASLALVFLSSCEKPSVAAPSASERGASPDSVERGAAPESAPFTLRVVYTEGRVERLAPGAAPAPLEPGAEFAQGETLRTGSDGFCDLEAEGLGTLRVLPSTTLRLELAAIMAGSARLRAELVSGRVLSKVRKLGAEESFMLQTKNAICGVRGTVFAMESRGDRSTLAVEEGRVALLPRGPVLDRLEEAAPASGAARLALKVAVALAPVAGPGEALSVGPAEAARADAVYAELERGLADIEAPPFVEGAALMSAGALEAEGAGLAAEAVKKAAPLLAPALPAAHEARRELPEVFESLRVFLLGHPETRLQAKPQATAQGATANPGLASGGKGAAPDQAIVGRAALFPGKSAARLFNAGSLLLAGDGRGEFVALDQAGLPRWRQTVDLGGTPSALGTAAPLLFKDRVYLVAEGALLALNAQSGEMLFRLGLPAAVFPTMLAPYPEGLLVATREGVLVYTGVAASSASSIETAAGPRSPSVSLPVEGGASAVAQFEGKVLAASRTGGLVLLDPARPGEVIAKAAGPASPFFRLYDTSGGSRAALVGFGRPDGGRGRAVLYALPSLEPLWDRSLDFLPATEPELAREGLFVYGEGRLAAFSLEGELRGTLEGLSAPPLLSRGVLYYGLSDGSFVAASPESLMTRATLHLPAPLAGRPLAFGEELRLPLKDGSVLFVKPGLMR